MSYQERDIQIRSARHYLKLAGENTANGWTRQAAVYLTKAQKHRRLALDATNDASLFWACGEDWDTLDRDNKALALALLRRGEDFSDVSRRVHNWAEGVRMYQASMDAYAAMLAGY